MRYITILLIIILLSSCKSNIKNTIQVTYFNSDKDTLDSYGNLKLINGCLYSNNINICGVRKYKIIN